MNSIQETAKSIIKEMQAVQDECQPEAAKYYRRMSIISYAEALKNAPTRSKEMTEQCFQEAYLYSEKAISLGIREERMEASFANLRAYWLPRLKDGPHAKD